MKKKNHHWFYNSSSELWAASMCAALLKWVIHGKPRRAYQCTSLLSEGISETRQLEQHSGFSPHYCGNGNVRGCATYGCVKPGESCLGEQYVFDFTCGLGVPDGNVMAFFSCWCDFLLLPMCVRLCVCLWNR